MNRETAQKHLLDWRPGQEPSSPEQAEALRLAETDPALGEWLSQHREVHDEIRGKLRAMPVPAGLKASILQGMPSQDKIIRPNFSRLLVLAASIVVLLSLGVLYFRTDSGGQLTAFRGRMVSNALRNYRMDLLTRDLGQIRTYLASAQWPADYQLPANLENLPGWGCARLTWQAKPVSMICFATSGRPDLYLFIADQQDVGGGGSVSPVVIQKDKKLVTATWTQAGKLYLLTGEGDEQALRGYLPKAL